MSERTIGWGMNRRRQATVILRFCAYELEEFDRIIQSNWGIFPRSSVVNAALNELINYAIPEDFEMCRKLKVNLLIDRNKLSKLDECAEFYRVNRSDLIRLAIRRFSAKHAGEIVTLPPPPD